MATPISIRALSHEFVLGIETVARIINEVSLAINKLFSTYLQKPNESTWRKNETEFKKLGRLLLLRANKSEINLRLSSSIRLYGRETFLDKGEKHKKRKIRGKFFS